MKIEKIKEIEVERFVPGSLPDQFPPCFRTRGSVRH
nr:MAG TPA: hypothetical protein [Caudoviricetes sp.]